MSLWQRIVLGASVPLILILIWGASSALGWVQPYVLPGPWAVLGYLAEAAENGSLFGHIAHTAVRVAGGFGMGLGFGLVLGLLTGLLPKVHAALDPLIQGFRSIPSLAWVPLFLLWLGIGEESKVALIAVGVFFPVYLNITAALAGVDRKLVELGRVLGLSRWELLWKIHLPSVAPGFWTGIRGGLGLGWMFVVAAEILGASRGLGYLLEYGRNFARPEITLGSILLFALLGKLTDGVLATLERKALSWRDSIHHGGG